jgi:hypothetical protein
MAAPIGFFQWMQTGQGVKYCFLKPTSWLIDCAKEGGYDVARPLLIIKDGCKEVRDLMSISEIPDALNLIGNSFTAFVANPTPGNGVNCFFNSLKIASPINDLAGWWNSRIAPIAKSTLDSFSKISAVALLILSVRMIYEDSTALYVAIVAGAWAGVPHTLLDLGRRVSVAALASLTLIALFFSIAIAQSYILACTAADIAFTIAGVFV